MIITKQSTKKIAVVNLAAAILLAILGLISYIPGLRVLGSVRSYYIPMPPSSAIAFLLLSAILILYIFGFWRGVRRFYGLTLLAIVSIYSFLVFAEYFFKIDVDFETYIFNIDESINEIPVGIMSAYAAIMFFLAAIIMILLILNANRKKLSNVLGHSSGILGSILFVSSSVFIMSYLFQNPLLYNLENTAPVALTTAIAFLFFAVALIIAVGVNYFPMFFFIGPSIRNRLLRIFIPLTVSIVIIQRFLYVNVIDIHTVNNVLMAAIVAVCFVALVVFIVFRVTSIISNQIDKAEVALQESEERYRTLFNTSQEGIIIMEIETNKFKYVNPAICKMLGYTEKELAVMDNSAIHPKEYSRNFKVDFQNQIHGINSLIKDVPCLRKDGTVFYADINAAPIVADGKKCIAGFFHDTTERKEIEEGLEKARRELETTKISDDASREYSESIINTIREPLIALDQDLRVVSASRSFYEFFKVKPGETLGQLIYDLGNKQWDIPKLRELLETILPQKATFDNYEIDHEFNSIGRHIMLLNARQIHRILGKERIILLAIEDITERRAIEDGLEKTRKELETLRISKDEALEFAENIIATIKEPLLVLDENLRVLSVNRSFYKFFKVTPKETIGKLIYDLGNKQWNIPKLRELLETILPQKTIFDNYEVDHEFNTIGRRVMLLNARQIHRKFGKKHIFLLIAADITERKKAEEEIKSLAKFPEQNPNIVGRLDYDGKLLFCNIGFKKIFNDNILSKFKDALKKISSEKKFTQVNIEIEAEDRIFLFNLVPIKDEKYINFYGKDITRQMRAELDATEHMKELQENRALLNNVSEIAHVGGWTFDPKTLTQTWTDETFRILEIDISKGEPKVPEGLDFIAPAYRLMADKAIKNAIKFGEPYDQEWEVITTKGNMRWVRAVAKAKKEQGEIKSILGSFQDITEQKNIEEKLKQQAQAMEAAIDGVAILNKEDKYMYLNKAHANIYGYDSPLELTGKSWTVLYDCDELERFKNDIMPMLIKNGHWQGEGIGMKKDGSKFFQELSLTALSDGGLICIVRNIDERKKREDEIIYLGYHDKLTDLYNRRFFEEELKRLDSLRQLPISIIMGDLNSLKLTNDAFGHNVGDTILKETAALLKRICRTEDILARWGGDEFVIILPKTSIENAEEIAQRIKKECRKTSNQKIPLSLAIGIATKTEAEQDIELIITEAESNMYKSKLVEQESNASSIIFALEQTLFEKSNETFEHTIRLKDNAIKLGKSVNLASNQLDELSLLASLHDIGKVAIPETILLKKGKLTEEEWAVIKRHPEIGFNIASSSPQIAHIAKYILACHENWDGSGYPQGLKGEAIPIVSRIMFIADAYDVMTSERSYHKSISKEATIKELRRCAGTQFDPVLVENFIKAISEVSDKIG